LAGPKLLKRKSPSWPLWHWPPRRLHRMETDVTGEKLTAAPKTAPADVCSRSLEIRQETGATATVAELSQNLQDDEHDGAPCDQ